MQTPLLSVIVPVYNAEKYLDRCVRSIVNQTYKRLEIILIDDGSTDRSGAMCDEWASVDSRIQVVHSENHGVSHARNMGLDLARGDWITFVDADDWIEPDMYELMITDGGLATVDICVGGYTMDIELTDDINPTRATPFCTKGVKQTFSRDETLIKMFSYDEPKLFAASIWDKIYRREIINGIRFDERYAARGEDTLYSVETLLKARATLYLPLQKYHYVMHSASSVHGNISTASARALECNDLIRRKLEGASNDVRAAFDQWYSVVVIGVLRVLMVLDADGYEQRIREGQRYIRNHLWQILTTNVTPTMARMLFIMGGVYFTLPFSVCKFLRPLIRMKTD